MATESIVATGSGTHTQVVVGGKTVWQLKTPMGLSAEVVTHSFSPAVTNLCWTVYDMDGPERLTIEAYSGGALIPWDPAWVLRVGIDMTDLGGGDFKGNSGSSAPSINNDKSFDLCIPGPVDKIVLTGTDTVSNSGRNMLYSFPTWLSATAQPAVAVPLTKPITGGSATVDPVASGATPGNIFIVDPLTNERVTSYTDPGGNLWEVQPNGSIKFTDLGAPETAPTSIKYVTTDGTYAYGGNSAEAPFTVTPSTPPPVAVPVSSTFPAGSSTTLSPIPAGTTSGTIQLIDPSTGLPVSSYTDPTGDKWEVQPDGSIKFTDLGTPNGFPKTINYQVTTPGGTATSTLTASPTLVPPTIPHCLACFKEVFGCDFADLVKSIPASSYPKLNPADYTTTPYHSGSMAGVNNTTTSPPVLLETWSGPDWVKYRWCISAHQAAGSSADWIAVPLLAGFKNPQLDVTGMQKTSTAAAQTDGGTDGATFSGGGFAQYAGQVSSANRIHIGLMNRDVAVEQWLYFNVTYQRL